MAISSVNSNSLAGIQPQRAGSATPQAQPQAPATSGDSVSLSQAKKDWTVLVYVASDTNLYQYQMDNIKDAEQHGSTPEMNVVAEWSKAPEGGGVQRLEVDKGQSVVKQDLGSQNMGTPAELADFIKWSKQNYPAKHYMLILNDHGNGWQGCCQDQSHGGWLTLPKLEEGLKQGRTGSDGKPLDVVGFDCCLMANVETADQLKDEANYLVGSEETEGGAGWQYNTVLSSKMLGAYTAALRSRDGLSPEQLARTSVEMAQGDQGDLPTMAAVDTSKVPALLGAAKNFSQALQSTSVPSAQLASVANQTQRFTMEKDFYDFADRVSSQFSGSDAKLGQAADAMKAGISDALVAEEHGSRFPHAHGMTVELNKNFDSHGFRINPDPGLDRISFDRYQNTKFAQDTGWDKAVGKIFAGPATDDSQGQGEPQTRA